MPADLALSKEQRRLVRIMIAPFVFRSDTEKRLPTYDEWASACDALYPPEQVKS